MMVMGLHVVVVEDDHDIGHLLMYQLEGKVLKTVLITHPKEALHETVWDLRNDFGVAGVIDLMLPNINGVEVAKWVKERFPDIPLIAVTAADPSSDIWQEAEEVFDRVLRKGEGVQPLLSALQELGIENGC